MKGLSPSVLSPMDMRDAFLTGLYDAAKADKRIMVLSDDFGAPALDRFRRDLPDQFVNVGISEQNMIGAAAGLAASGFRPVVYAIATFATLRCLEQIKIDLCVMKLPVTIVAVGTGYAYSADGPTHHATEDIAIMRTMANLVIYSPSEPAQCKALAATVAAATEPRYVRLDRGKWPVLETNDNDVTVGVRAFGEGKDCAIVATGNMVHRALETKAELIKDGVDAKVLDLYRLKPLNQETLGEALRGVSCVVTLDEQSLHGGLGGIIAEFVIDSKLLLPVMRLAIPDELLYAYGLRQDLHAERSLDVAGIKLRIKRFIAEHLPA